MKRFVFVFLAFLFLLLSVSVSAHPGRTDEDGGHYDQSTGEYHWHHGYEAHQHYDIDGDGVLDCPLEYNLSGDTVIKRNNVFWEVVKYPTGAVAVAIVILIFILFFKKGECDSDEFLNLIEQKLYSMESTKELASAAFIVFMIPVIGLSVMFEIACLLFIKTLPDSIMGFFASVAIVLIFSFVLIILLIGWFAERTKGSVCYILFELTVYFVLAAIACYIYIESNIKNNMMPIYCISIFYLFYFLIRGCDAISTIKERCK